MTPGDRRPWLPVALLLLQVPGCSSLSGPTSVTGTVGGSLSVQCQYEEKFRDIAKYWCKSPCLGDIVKIEKSDKEVRNGRVSIRNHPVNLTFTVTLENLTEGDAGTYRCGIDTSWLPGYLLDVTFHVVVSVTPGLHRTLPAPTWSTTTPQESPSPSQHPLLLPEGHAVEDQASKGVERSLLSRTYFRLLVFLEVPLLLSMLSAVL